MENDLISIIVPVYNVENFIERCLISIINQTYKNLEIIVINDGSTDLSLNICEKIAQKDKRLKIFSKKNGGASSARNYGLSKANGKYISFIDSDDFVEFDFISKLYENLINTQSDISVCGVKKIKDQNFNEFIYIDNSCIVFDKKNAYSEMIKNEQFAGYACNKLYKKDIIMKLENEYFKEYMIEDFEFNSRILNYCNKIVFDSNKLYCYCINPNGITQSFRMNDRILNGIKAYESILYEYDKNEIGYGDLVAYYALKYIYNVNYKIYKLKYKTNTKIIDNNLFKRVMKSDKISIKNKISVFIIKVFPIISYSIKFKIRRNKNG